MKLRHSIILGVSLALILGAAALLMHQKNHRRLGNPGVKTEPIPGSDRLKVVLPAQVLDYDSEEIETDKVTMDTLPKDTSFGLRQYKATDGFTMSVNVVLMGTDRTSIHKPQFCLPGAGWNIDETKEAQVRIHRPQAYDLPIVKLTATREISSGGQKAKARAVFIYWCVCDGAISGQASGRDRMWWMAKELLRTGVLQRWAYVMCGAGCQPGQEEAAFRRIQEFLATAVPEFQLTPKPATAPAAAAKR